MDLEKKLLELIVSGGSLAVFIVDNTEEMAKDPDRYRAYFLNDYMSALYFAYFIDEGPHDDTREAVLKDPKSSYHYAFETDKHPRDDTRKACCKDPYWAYAYARDVDYKPKRATREAVKGTCYEDSYKRDVIDPIRRGYKC